MTAIRELSNRAAPCWRDQNLSGVNFAGDDLSWLDARRANLSACVLTYTNLADSDLNGASLNGADCRSACFDGANLAGADLRGAVLTGASFARAELAGATFDDETRLDPWFDPAARGAVYEEPYTDLTGIEAREVVDPAFHAGWSEAYDHA